MLLANELLQVTQLWGECERLQDQGSLPLPLPLSPSQMSRIQPPWAISMRLIAMGTVLSKHIAMTTVTTGAIVSGADMRAVTAGNSALRATAMGTVATVAIVFHAIAMGAGATRAVVSGEFRPGGTITEGANTLGSRPPGAHNLWSRWRQVALIMHFHIDTSGGSSEKRCPMMRLWWWRAGRGRPAGSSGLLLREKSK